MTDEKPKTTEEESGTPICEECGNAKILEGEEWACPHCQGEIDFLGGDDE